MTTPRPFRFGLLANQARSADEWAATAQRAEAEGYATLLMPDYVGPGLAPLPGLTAAAGATRTIRLGTYVLANDYRNPVQLAREVATLDLLSGGRFELGIGAGRPTSEADDRAAGVPHDTPGARIARLEEALGILKTLLSGGKVEHSGPLYNIAGTELRMQSMQQPHPPILIAGGGRRILSLAAREADSIGLGIRADQGEAALAERIGWVREAAGARFDDLELNIGLIAVVPDPANPPPPRYGVDAAQLLRAGSPYVLAGSPDEMCAQLERLRATYGISYFKSDAGLMDGLAPVVERLAGR
jgi:probable F420-dependent oxidoreductase